MMLLSETTIQGMIDAYEGICLACGEPTEGVEPDARNYECPSCGKHEVCGTEEALIMGYLAVGPDDCDELGDYS